MSTYAWSPAPRPAGGTVEVVGAGCLLCGRPLYVDVRAVVPGQPHAFEDERCRGCDELALRCYCPSATVPA